MTASVDPLVEHAARAYADSQGLHFGERVTSAHLLRGMEAVLAVVVPLVERDVRERIDKALDQTPHRHRGDWVKEDAGVYAVRPDVPTFDCADVRRVVRDA